ncbi:hypothetical protein PM082_007607 [Marasmius tenuissimus]|nr:hypothetical protein PM082_007607 [Marasmius tenuissimus]
MLIAPARFATLILLAVTTCVVAAPSTEYKDSPGTLGEGEVCGTIKGTIIQEPCAHGLKCCYIHPDYGVCTPKSSRRHCGFET